MYSQNYINFMQRLEDLFNPQPYKTQRKRTGDFLDNLPDTVDFEWITPPPKQQTITMQSPAQMSQTFGGMVGSRDILSGMPKVGAQPPSVAASPRQSMPPRQFVSTPVTPTVQRSVVSQPFGGMVGSRDILSGMPQFNAPAPTRTASPGDLKWDNRKGKSSIPVSGAINDLPFASKNNAIQANSAPIPSTSGDRTSGGWDGTYARKANAPSSLSVGSKSFAAGFPDAATAAVNALVRMPVQGLNMALGQDPNAGLAGVANKYVSGQERLAQKTIDSIGRMTPGQEVFSSAVRATPNVLTSALMGGGISAGGRMLGSAAAQAGRLIPAAGTANKAVAELARMLPFGVSAAGSYAMEAEKEGASYTQQLMYGAAGALAEMGTELPVVSGVLGLAGKLKNVPGVERGAKNALQLYGGAAIDLVKNIGKETLQEAAISPVSGAAKKVTYKGDMPIYGEGGVIDPGQIVESGAAGGAMSTILTAFGLPTYTLAHVRAAKLLRGGRAPRADEVEQINQDIKNGTRATQKDIADASALQVPASQIFPGQPIGSATPGAISDASVSDSAVTPGDIPQLGVGLDGVSSRQYPPIANTQPVNPSATPHQALVNSVMSKLNSQSRQSFDNVVNSYVQQGIAQEQAELKALEGLEKTAEGKKVLEQAIPEATAEVQRAQAQSQMQMAMVQSATAQPAMQSAMQMQPQNTTTPEPTALAERETPQELGVPEQPPTQAPIQALAQIPQPTKNNAQIGSVSPTNLASNINVPMMGVNDSSGTVSTQSNELPESRVNMIDNELPFGYNEANNANNPNNIQLEQRAGEENVTGIQGRDANTIQEAISKLEERVRQSVDRSIPQGTRVYELIADEVRGTERKVKGQKSKQEVMRERDAEAAMEIADLFGHKLAFIRVNPKLKVNREAYDKANNFNGANVGGVIVLNVDRTNPAHAVTGHEVVHEMAKDKEIYNEFISGIKSITSEEGHATVQGMIDIYKENGMNLSEDKAWEEFAADMIGEQMTTKSFWEKLAKRAPGAVQKAIEAIGKIVASLRKKVNPANSVREFINDLEMAEEYALWATSRYLDKTVQQRAESALTEPDKQFLQEIRDRMTSLGVVIDSTQDAYDKKVNEMVGWMEKEVGDNAVLKHFQTYDPDAVAGQDIKWHKGGSTHAKWYRDFWAMHNKRPNKAEIKDIAKDFLRNGIPAEESYMGAGQDIPADVEFLELEAYLNELQRIDAAITRGYEETKSEKTNREASGSTNVRESAGMTRTGTEIQFSTKRGKTNRETGTKAKGKEKIKVSPWPKDFPNVFTMTGLSNLKSITNGNAKLHERAKSGDIEAALKLVSNVVKKDRIQEIGRRYPDATIAYVHAIESTGKNKLPTAYAMAISKTTGLKIETDIVQSNKASRTKLTSIERLFRKVEFDGPVKSGYNYVIVDDVVTQGGTTRNLREHIESHGGHVVAVAALAPAQGKDRTLLAVTDETINQIKKRFDYEEINSAIKEFGISEGAEWLTEHEGRLLLTFRSVDSFRNRGIKERFKGGSQNSGGILQEESAEISNEINNDISSESPDNKGDFFMTKSDAFKKWFRKSKVVDENGEPLVVYHNTDKEFNEFDISASRQSQDIPGFFFADNPGDYADMGSRQIQAYLSIQKPYTGDYSNYKGIKGGSTDTAYKEIREALIEDGYDGIIVRDDDAAKYIAFNSTQIKSVDNQGTFDLENPDIRFQLKADPFYSKMEQVIEKKVQKSATPAQVLAIVDNPQNVKPEEVKWSGIRQWLQGKRKVAKEEILEFLRGNKLQIKEVEHRKQSGIKYGQYTLPGGENYKELLFILPERVVGEEFTSTHWEEKNVLAHTRFNERQTTDGKRVLFVEEVQSDWHQAGRDKGYKGDSFGDIPSGWAIKQEENEWVIYDENGNWQYKGDSKDSVLKQYQKQMDNYSSAVPDAPFRKTWHEFVLKRLIRLAAENNFDYMAWTTGKQQADRYNLRKHIDRITYIEDTGDLIIHDHNDNMVLDEMNVTPEKLPEYIGADIAKKIMDQDDIPTPEYGNKKIRTLQGVGLESGGEGMISFYDIGGKSSQNIPKFLDKYVKQWGAKVSQIRLAGTGEDGKESGTMQPAINITPQMKESALYEGQPLFQLKTTGGWGAARERGFSRNVRTDENMNPEIRKIFDKDPLIYSQLSNKETLDKAQKIFDLGYDEAMKEWHRGLGAFRPEDVPLSRMLANEAISRGDHNTARQIISDIAEKLTMAGQFTQAASILRKADPRSVITNFEKWINKLNKQGQRQYGKKWEDIVLSDEELQKLKDSKDADEVEREKLFSEIWARIASRLPVSGWEKWDAWRRIAMLTNPKTHLRNIFGNVIMRGMETSADKIAAGLEAAAVKSGKMKQESRTKKMGWRKDKTLVGVVDKDWEAVKKDLGRIGKYEVETGLKGLRSLSFEKPIYKTKSLEKLNRFSMDLLNLEDVIFMRVAYKDALGQFMRARRLKEVTVEARKYAERRALEATYKEANRLSTLIQEYKASGSLGGRLLDAAFPFTKTPLNIVSRAIDYSPAGLLRVLFSTRRPPEEVIEMLAKGLTGTGIVLLGYLLANWGWARGSDDKKKKGEELTKLSGDHPYSITTPKGSYKLDWAQPFSVPFFMGVVAKEKMEEQDEFSFETVFDAIAAGGDTIFELSMLQTIKDFTGYSSTTGNIMGLPVDYVKQGIPTILRQTAYTVDTTKRSGFGSDDYDKLKREIYMQIPGVSKVLEPRLNILGQEQKQGNWFQQYFNPGLWTWKSKDPVVIELQRLYDSAGTADMIPKLAPHDFAYDKKEYKLAPKDVTAWQKAMGQMNYEDIYKAINHPEYADLDDEERVDGITKIVNKNYKIVKDYYLDYKGVERK